MSLNALNSKSDDTIIEELEQEYYMKNEFSNIQYDEVQSKIEEFSNWFNSIARLYFLRCDSEESESFIYLLLNLKKKIKFAISEINRSVSNTKKSFICSVCDVKVDIEPWQNVWSVLQEHPHFEEVYSKLDNVSSTNSDICESGESSTSIDSDPIKLLCEYSKSFHMSELLKEFEEQLESPQNGLNDFKFNFVVTYDSKVEETLYPESLVNAARRRDKLLDYTVQRCGPSRGVCLLCPCNLISKGRTSKITPYIIKNHTSGQRHLKCASSFLNTNALKHYHEFWRSQDSSVQAHQVHFIPEVTSVNHLKCSLCQEFVNYSTVIKHIQDTSHKSKVLKAYTFSDGKQAEFYLLNMQVQIYEEVKNIKKEEKPKEVTPTDNGIASPNCVFEKFHVEPDGLNLPPRYKEHVQFFKNNSNTVTCSLCKMSFNNVVSDIRSHIYSSQHKEKSGLSLPKYKFYCEICNIHIKDEPAWEDHFTKGPNRHVTMPQTRKVKVAEYECKTCMVVIYGDDLSISRHISRGGKPGKAKELKLSYPLRRYFKSKNFIEAESRRLQTEANIVLENQGKMLKCLESVEEALSSIYPDCKAYPFGSRISGIGNNQSDLDVFIDTGDMYLGEYNQDSDSQEQFVKKVAKLLKSKSGFSSVFPIPSARTPIVKLHHIATDMDCDLSFRHGLGVENTKFLRFCIDLQPITQPFILLLKKWSEFCKLNEHITNYALALMAVFFLQINGYLLSVTTVRCYNPSESTVIDGWETLTYTVPTEELKQFVKPYNAGMKILLRNFFYYFAKFDYANQVVCPLIGQTIPKLWFNEKPREKLPAEMKSYILRVLNENGEQFRSLAPFCIQDPFDLSHNLAKACQHGTITKLKTFCNLTYEYLDMIE